MIINKYLTIKTIIIIFLKIQQSKFFVKRDEIFENTLKLDTGFKYPDYNQLRKLNLNKLLRTILEEQEIKSYYRDKNSVMYYDLRCANFFNLRHFMILSKYFIENNLLDNIILSESITKHMVISEIYTMGICNKTFWTMHMVNYKVQQIRNIKPNDTKYIKQMYEFVWLKIKYDIQLCRKKNNYDKDTNSDDPKEKSLMLQNIIAEMERRTNYNNIILGIIEKENFVSLEHLSFNYIIENKNVLKTVIMEFGEQTEEIFEKTYQNIFNDYRKIKNNDLSFDYWIEHIADYKIKMLDIFKTVLLHLIKKQAMYGNLLPNNTNTKTVVKSLKKINGLLSNTHDIMVFFNDLRREISTVLKSFNNFTPSYSIMSEEHKMLISYIQGIIKNIKPKYFEFDENISDPQYLSNLKNTVQNLILTIGLLKNDSDKKTTTFKNTIEEGMYYNFSLTVMYLRYLGNIFNGFNFKCFWSFIEFSKSTRLAGSFNTVSNIESQNLFYQPN
ncbi:uncharacterized protein LOC126899566 [Daktulosphaira vitifoliae]|uniref:uncharacterized protein LOC126899566 n=1 Tax=Daktulosphaira vitifoliae TaxID=58002 RepID=UPI0021A9FF9A|nr:uncharacterized protein LOC126899566 [Daktulosphaira vitifoliae]